MGDGVKKKRNKARLFSGSSYMILRPGTVGRSTIHTWASKSMEIGILGGGREKQSAVINTIGNEADPILVSSSFHALESNNSAYMYTRPFYTWMSSAFTGMDSNLVSPYTIAHAEDLTSMISMVSTTKYVWVCELLHGLTQYISYRPTDSHCMLGWGAYSSFPGVMGRGKGRGRRVGWGESWGGGIRGVGGWSYLKLPCFVHFHH